MGTQYESSFPARPIPTAGGQRQQLDLNMDSGAPLVARARRGDDVAFGQLVRRHHASVHRAARAILGSAADAEDVVQEAWLQAYMHLARFQGTASFKTWVHAIVRNRAIDHHRSARSRRWHGGTQPPVPVHAALRSHARSPEELVLDAERQDRLAAAIATLPGRLRGLLEQWHTGQYSYEEMAERAGVAIGTIKSQVWQARQRVTQAMSVSVTGCKQVPPKSASHRRMANHCIVSTVRPMPRAAERL